MRYYYLHVYRGWDVTDANMHAGTPMTDFFWRLTKIEKWQGTVLQKEGTGASPRHATISASISISKHTRPSRYPN